MDTQHLEEALNTLGAILEDRGLHQDLAIVGGGALLMIGLIERPTKDLDVVARIEEGAWLLARPFPEGLRRAVIDVAEALALPSDWLNPGPTDLLTFGLPEGFESRAVVRDYGALRLRIAARVDQIKLKLYAATDHWPARGKHWADLRLLHPEPQELIDAARWCRTHDPSLGFRDQLLLPLLAALGLKDADV